MKKIVAAIDFSDASKPVVAAAARLAKALNEGLHLVHVVEAEPTYAAYGFSPDDFPAMHEIRLESVSRGEAKLQQIASEIDVTGVQAKVLQGQPLGAILDYAKEANADILVVGSHGHGLLGSILLGSVAEGCVRKAEIPALVVPVPKRAKE